MEKEKTNLSDEQQKKINAIREKAKRGMEMKKSPETIEKMKRSAEERWKKEREDTSTYSLEDILEQAESELEISCDIVNFEILDQSKFRVQANGETGSFILDYTAHGEEEAFKRVKQMLSWEKTKTVTISLIDRPDLSEIDQKLTSIVKVGERYMLGIDYWSKEEVEKRNRKSNRP